MGLFQAAKTAEDHGPGNRRPRSELRQSRHLSDSRISVSVIFAETSYDRTLLSTSCVNNVEIRKAKGSFRLCSIIGAF